MNNEIKCEKCGSLMTYTKQEHTHGYICPNCGNGFVTSYFDPIELDKNIYKLIIKKFESTPTTHDLKTINTITPSKNLLQIRKEIMVSEYVIENHAIEIARIAKVLKDGNIAFSITPDFSYEY